MSHWNYRILATVIDDLDIQDVRFTIHEVHYDDNNEPVGFTENSIIPVAFISEPSDPIESIDWQLEAMKLALKKPVLDYNNFPNEYFPYTRKKKLEEIEKHLQ